MVNARKLKKRTIVISYIVFFTGWTVRVAFVDLSGLNEFTAWAIGFMIHFVWWFLFAFILIKHFSADLNVSFVEMTSTKPERKILLPILTFALLYNVVGHIFDSSGYGTSMKMYDLIVTALTVGIFEEGVFRAWFLNAISCFVSERKANLISSVLFVLIHYPGWICAGYDLSAILITSISVYALSIILGWCFRKNRSIWCGAMIHSFWDLLTWIL